MSKRKTVLDYEGEVSMGWTRYHGYGTLTFHDNEYEPCLGEILEDWLEWTPKHYRGRGRLHILVELVEEGDDG